MLMDVSSELIHALLPVYLVTVLGASATSVGIIEGAAEATASVVKIFSGALSDAFGKRKLLAAAGYGLSALTKPIFPLAGTVAWVIAARVVDRIGKGLRGAPRDALLAELAPAPLRAASFGLRQALDTVGAVGGPLLAIALMTLTGERIQVVFWIAALPAFLAFALIVFAVAEPARPRAPASRDLQRRLAFGRSYWIVTLVAALFTMARFSEAFLVLRAQSLGVALALVPAVLVVTNIAYALSAYPAGVAADRGERASVLFAGLAALLVADLVLAAPLGLPGLALGIVLWGLHMGLTQGVLAALIADCAPLESRGAAYGVFNAVTGVCALLASVLAGVLWDRIGAPATFIASAGLAIAALIALLATRRALPRREE